MNIKEKINVAFRELRKAGYFARQDFWCCQTCGWAGVPQDKAKKAVFYHAQDLETFKRTGVLWLAWAGDGFDIVRIFGHAGLKVEWNGDEGTRIKVVGEI